MGVLDGWVLLANRATRFVHLVPVEDYRLHELSEKCWCDPIIDDSDDVVTHHALDRREAYEHLPPQ